MDVVVQEHAPATLRPSIPGSMPYDDAAHNSAQDEVGFLTRLRRHKFLFSAVFSLSSVAIASAYFIIPPTYKANALVTIAAPEQLVASDKAGDRQQLTIGDTADLESQSIILASPATLRKVVVQEKVRSAVLQECRLAGPSLWEQQLRHWLQSKPQPSCEEQVADIDKMVTRLQDRVQVSVSGRSRVLALSVTSPLPDVAATIANAVVETYLAAQKEEKLQPRDEAIAWLKSQLQAVESRLKLTETSIQTFLQTKGVVRGETAPVASEQLTSLAQQIAVAEAERAATAGRMLQAVGNGATTSVLENRTVNDDKQQLATINGQIAQLSARYGSAYPPLADLQQQRRALEQAIVQDTNTVQHSAASDYQSATNRVSALQRQMEELKQEVRGNDNATTQMASLQRTLSTDQELYIDLSRSLNQIETERRLSAPNVRLISLAEIPSNVFFPKASSFALTGVLLSTAIACIAALLVDRADKSVRSVRGLQTVAEIRVLARIPHVSGIGRSGIKIRERLAAPSAFQEAIRKLYAECLLVNVRLADGDRRPRTILVTSSDRGEGKTFTALALAYFAASAGRRVLMLECDLRQPSMTRTLLLRPTWGMSEVLQGQILAEDAVLPSATPGLDIIPAGNAVANSVELLGGSRFAQLISWGAAHYDLVIVDSPPSQILPDAGIMAPMVDGILYCARWGLSDTDLVVRGVRDLGETGGQLLGLVVNDFDPARYSLYDKSRRPTSDYLPVN